MQQLHNGDFAAVIGGGSGDVDLSIKTPLQEQLFNRAGQLVTATLQKEIPLFAICVTDHVLAEVIGGSGTVVSAGKKAEGGTVLFNWTDEGREHSISKGMPGPAHILSLHKDLIKRERLPSGTTVYAWTEDDDVSMYGYAEAFGFQPHPDYTPKEVEVTFRETNERLEKTGLPPFPQTHPFSETDHPQLIVVNFLDAIKVPTRIFPTS